MLVSLLKWTNSLPEGYCQVLIFPTRELTISGICIDILDSDQGGVILLRSRMCSHELIQVAKDKVVGDILFDLLGIGNEIRDRLPIVIDRKKAGFFSWLHLGD